MKRLLAQLRRAAPRLLLILAAWALIAVTRPSWLQLVVALAVYVALGALPGGWWTYVRTGAFTGRHRARAQTDEAATAVELGLTARAAVDDGPRTTSPPTTR